MNHLKAWLQVLLWLLLTPLIGALLARWVDPQKFWLLAPLADLYNLLSAATLLPIVALIVIRASRPAALLALALLLVTHFPTRLILVTQPASDADIKLLTYNMPRGTETPEVLARASQLFASQDADLVLLQETRLAALLETPTIVHGPPKAHYLLNGGGYLSSVPTRLATSGKWFTLPQPVVAREQPLHFEEITSPDLPSGSASLNRIPLHGKFITVINLHLATFGPDKPWSDPDFHWLSLQVWKNYLRQWKSAYQTRSRQATKLSQIIRDTEGPLIVAGDLNSTTRSWVYHKIKGSLQDVFTKAGTGWGGSFHAKLPILRIDHVLVSNHFKPTGAAVVKTDAEMSDHRPVVARFQWRH